MDCNLCGCEVDYLEVVRDALVWNGGAWVKDDKAVSVIRCPECGDELDTGDLAIMGVKVELIQEIQEGGKK